MSLAEDFLPLLGHWTGLEEQAASPWAPASGARAGFTFKLDVGGTAVVQDYRQVREDGAEFFGHGVFLLELPGRVRWWFFDSSGVLPTAAEGAWRDSELLLEKTTPRGRARHRFIPGPDQLRYEVSVAVGDAAELTPFLIGTYRRISGH